jgi:hypothetical protein
MCSSLMILVGIGLTMVVSLSLADTSLQCTDRGCRSVMNILEYCQYGGGESGE